MRDFFQGYSNIGMDLFYEGSLAEYYDNNGDHDLTEVHTGYNFMSCRFNTRVQPGAYLSDDRGKDIFIRPALQYRISKDFYAQVDLKTGNGAGVNWIEICLG